MDDQFTNLLQSQYLQHPLFNVFDHRIKDATFMMLRNFLNHEGYQRN